MAKTFKEFFIAERAEALAIKCLTRRQDLVIQDTKAELGLDYLVQIVPADGPSQRSFGVLLRAVMESVTVEKANQMLGPIVRDFRKHGPFPYPVCLFFFTMRDDRGYSTWLLEPEVTEAGKPRLPIQSQPDCRSLDTEAIDRIVAQVNAWYDALYADLTASS